LKRVRWFWWLILVLLLIVGGVGYHTYKDYQQTIIKGPNNHIYQRTKTYSPSGGKINRKIYSQSQLEDLTRITHGSQYAGNLSLDYASTTHVFQLNGENIPNIVGPDGVLQLYTQSKFMTPTMVQDAATYWNKLAGMKIIKIVNHQNQSDEVIRDGKNKQAVLGGQTYNGQGILFYPKNWHISDLSKKNQNNWKEAALIHEIGHALGIPHLGGGVLGANASNAGLSVTEFMGPWSVGRTDSPSQNELGVRSTDTDAATLALAGLSWQNPKKLAEWVLADRASYVIYDDGRISSTIP